MNTLISCHTFKHDYAVPVVATFGGFQNLHLKLWGLQKISVKQCMNRRKAVNRRLLDLEKAYDGMYCVVVGC